MFKRIYIAVVDVSGICLNFFFIKSMLRTTTFV